MTSANGLHSPHSPHSPRKGGAPRGGAGNATYFPPRPGVPLRSGWVGPIIRLMKNGFLADLARYGPDGRAPLLTPAEAQAYCSRLARTHYENFTVASLLLPGPLQRHFHSVYAYCRWADDLADEAGGGPRALALLT